MGLTVAGLFAGIGGIELGLHAAGHETVLLCEIDPAAQATLRRAFPGVPLHPDVVDLPSIPAVDLCAAGFPCTDLSQAGRTAGIGGRQSGLVAQVFRLIDKTPPTWLLLENVPFMLQLDRGKAMHFLTDQLSDRGYRWAYRVVDARAFGLPQRRKRVILLASRSEDPRPALFHETATSREGRDRVAFACGFYWTEGIRGLGWAVDAVPTLKGGSSVGIASPPGIWMPDDTFVTPGIRDAERLQGFKPGWTDIEVSGKPVRPGHRWKLVGNAVSVPVAAWAASRLNEGGASGHGEDTVLQDGDPWPLAAWGHDGKAFRVDVSTWPRADRYKHLAKFVRATKPLSARATAGFLGRTRRSSLRFPPGFQESLEMHLKRMRAAQG